MTQQATALYFCTTILFVPKVIQSSDPWKMPENGTEFPCCSCEIVHVDETKELFIRGITVSQRDEATKAEVVAMFKQVRLECGDSIADWLGLRT